MKRKIAISILCSLVAMCFSVSSFTVYAEETALPEPAAGMDGSEKSDGLIQSYSLAISGGTKTVCINATTRASGNMAQIGFTGVSIQRSANGISGWTEEKSLANDCASNTHYHEKLNEYEPVTGGAYYRVVLNHYAKETGWFFPKSESIPNCSNVVWVSA